MFDLVNQISVMAEAEDFDIEDELHFFAEPCLYEPEWTEEELRQQDEAAAAAAAPDHGPAATSGPDHGPDHGPAATSGPDPQPAAAAAAAGGDRSRAQETWWCSCTRCRPMPTDEESLCCADWELATPTLEKLDISSSSSDSDAAVVPVAPVAPPTPCITDQQEFPPLLSRGVLEVMLHSSQVSWKRPRPRGPRGHRLSEEQCRLVAFRVVLEWVLKGQRLPAGGKHSKVFPSCIVGAVRDTYPSPTGLYEGSKEPELAFEELLR